MFRNQKTKPKDPEARKELEAEENIDNDVSGTDLFGSLLNTGNENAVKEIIGNNIIKNTEDDDDDTDLFAGFGEEDKKKSKPAPKKKPVNIIQEDDDDGGDLFGDFGEEASKESDPGAAAIKNQIKKIKGGVIKENAKKSGEIKIPAKQYGLKDASKNIYPGEKPAIQEFYEDPEEEPHIDYQGEGELNRRVHYRKPKHTDADADRSRNKKFSDWRIENAKKARKKELERINDEQKSVAGLDFTLQKLPARNKAGWFRKFLTNLAIAAGSTIGKGFNWIGAQFRRLFDSSFAANYNLAKSDKAKNPAITQKKRVHDVIPGWNGEKFQKGPNGEDNILADFRRIPTVWSTITAGQAEDKKGKPLPPKISIYVIKGGEDDKTLEGKDAGHAGLGIEYSRYSRRSNRYERYNLRYGFYPAGDEKKAGSLTMTGHAVIPAQLKDEAYQNYTIRRTFPATARQVNDILQASETYADKGYNTYNRNCTTFVKEMVEGKAGIKAGKEIFEQETPGFSSLVNFGMFVSKSSEFTARASMEGRMKHLASMDDLNYGGEGNKRATKQDYRQYKESLKKGSSFIGKADLPNAAAENMRRLEGKDAGTLGSKQYTGTARVIADKKSSSGSGSSGSGGSKPVFEAENLRSAMHHEAVDLIAAIMDMAGKNTMQEFINTPNLDENLKKIFMRIGLYDRTFDLVSDKDEENDPDKLRQARRRLETGINDLNKLLSIFHNDERLHMPVMHMISMLEWGILFIDDKYEGYDIKNAAERDLGNIRDRMNIGIEISYRNQDRNRIETDISPSHYESYLQIFKSPRKAIDSHSRFKELKAKAQRTEQEEEDFKKLKRIDDLAWQYDAAHNYMLEKDSYSQQDVDYAFSLGNLEKQEGVTGSLFRIPASDIYKSLILEKIFGELTQRFENNFTAEEARDEKKVQEFLDNDMCECIKRKPDELKNVIRSIKKSKNKSTPESVLTALMDLIKDNWIWKVFDGKKFDKVPDKQSNPIYNAKATAINAYKKIIKNSQLKTELSKIVRQIFNEEARQDIKAEDRKQ